MYWDSALDTIIRIIEDGENYELPAVGGDYGDSYSNGGGDSYSNDGNFPSTNQMTYIFCTEKRIQNVGLPAKGTTEVQIFISNQIYLKIFKGGEAGDDYSSYYGRKRRETENYVVNWENRGKLSKIQLEDESVLAPKVSKSRLFI